MHASPKISVLLPVYKVEPYIEECLDSLLSQTSTDFEIIAVDGCSTDNTRELLEKKRLDEPRLTVFRASERGPGQARNIGADLARGEYLWFVDGDDEVAPEAVLAVAERLRSDRPDVLVINHQVLEADGLTDGQDERLLAAEQGSVGPLTERPWLIDISMVSWNKIARREFFQASAGNFSPQWPHEDVAVSCRLMLRADRISVLHQVCYHFRRERPGSATKTGDPRRHFTALGAWESVLADAREQALAGDPAMPVSVYHWLFQRAIWHCSTILDARPAGFGPYIADGDRKEFFGRMADLYDDYKLRGYRRPGGLRGVKFRLIASRLYWAYAIGDRMNRRRVRLEDIAKSARPGR